MMTAAELKKFLQDVPDAMEVMVEIADDWGIRYRDASVSLGSVKYSKGIGYELDESENGDKVVLVW